ncbi:MAG: hypothetical protein IPM97_08860 [Bdellovibrionaceae bacterium]|nr:hypothetical protein [Pseudobdellovibrionaceae bacterium]
MFFQVKLKPIVVAILLGVIAPTKLFASEKPPAKEEKKEEAGAADSGRESGVTESQKKQLNEAAELQTHVQALQAKVKTKEENIKRLVEEKSRSTDAAKIKEIIQEMVKEHREMGKMIEEYEQNRSLLRYRYPEKGYKGVRTYERMEVKPLEQMESQISLEAKLKRNMKTLQSQFGSNTDKNVKKKKNPETQGHSAPGLTEPIVIQK